MSSASDERLQEIVAAFLQDVEAGKNPDRATLLAKHPDLADELRSFLAEHDRMRRLVDQQDLATIGHGLPANGTGVGATVRYFGDYELIAEIARGGMGVVYRARQVSLNRIVALKMILSGQLASAADVQRFHVEAEAAANLDHPNIVPIYEVGEHEGQHFFSMRLVEGGSLAANRPTGRADLHAAAKVVATVARAVHYAHQRGIFHRDLKPANVLLDAHGEPHVTDFGLAKRVEGDSKLTQSGAIVGTPSYMPPEQAAGRKDLTTAVDTYSLGAILYDLLTGRPPFRAATPMDTILQVLGQEPERPCALNPQVSRDLETICLKCLHKEPARRYGSAEMLADDLERWRRGEPILARPVRTPERVWRWCRRNPAVAAALTAVVATVLLGAGVSLHFGVAAEREARIAKENEEKAKKNEQLARDEKALSDRRYHAAEIRLAGIGWDAGQAALVLPRLEALLPSRADDDLRGFEWYYLKRQCDLDQRTLRGHQGNVFGVAFSPDGRRLASGSEDGTIKVWDTATGRETLSFTATKSRARRLAFSPDGKSLAIADWDGVRLWDAVRGKPLRVCRGHKDQVYSVAFSRDGRRIASASADGTVKVWNTADGKDLLTIRGHKYLVLGVAFSPDGTRVVSSGSEGQVKVWDAVSGQELRTLAISAAGGGSVAYGPDGQLLAAVGYDAVTVWDESGMHKPVIIRGHADPTIWEIAFSPDSRYLAMASGDHTIRVWYTSSGKEAFTLRGHTGAVGGVAFSPDGRRIASSSMDQTVKLWDAANAQRDRTLRGHVSNVYGVAFSSKGDRLASASLDGTVKVWDAATGAETLTFRGHSGWVLAVAISPDGRHIASTSMDQTLKVWEAVTGQELFTARFPKLAEWGVAFSPDGRHVAVAGNTNDHAKLYDAATGKETMRFAARKGGSDAVAFSPDGTRLATGHGSGTVTIWDATNGGALLTMGSQAGAAAPGPHNIHAVAFSHDGNRLAAAGADGTVKLWDAATGALTLTLRGHTGEVRGVAFSLDDRRVVSAGDSTIRLWDARTGQETLTLRNPGGEVRGLALDADGRRLAVSDNTGVVRFWDATPLAGELLLEREADGIVRDLLGKWLSPEQAEKHIRDDACISEPLRTKALAALPRHAAERSEHAQRELAALTAAAEREPPSANARWARGVWHVYHARWADAAADCMSAIALDPKDVFRWYQTAPILLQAGKIDDYRRHCRAMRQHFGTTQDPRTAGLVARACLLLPDAENLDSLAALADRALGVKIGDPELTKALADYRQGRHAAAETRLAAQLADSPRWLAAVPAQLLLAMAQHQQKHTDPARRTFAGARAILDRDAPHLPETMRAWNDWLVMQILRREAEALIEG